MNDADDLRIWAHTLDRIASGKDPVIALAGSPVRTSRAEPCSLTNDVTPVSTRKIRLLERPTCTTAILSWSDSTSCRYGYQRWCVCRAERAGVCVLSRLLVAKGDEVYRPRLAGPRPRNADAMILRWVLECGCARP
ncbi:uncharacterized protein DUF3331 [Paraburkholderia sp. BL6669N2]|uniref:DUF3331 domain-containing protein n=1 Tax=Paraburkholderia sp. BL6669N2 TaxID=1938807 RepID=UPI000E27AFA6|nr:uncharacterized protein DUF3331 [Paraburkholderia sp. BL6669N2]